VGLGPIPMMIGAELFRQGPRPRALSLAGLVNWFMTAVIAISFEPIQKVLNEYTFLIFLGLMIFFTIFVVLKVPETKNKTFEEIAANFQRGGNTKVEDTVDDVFDQTSKTPRNGDANNNQTREMGMGHRAQMAPSTTEKISGYVPYVPNPHYIYQPSNFNLPPGRLGVLPPGRSCGAGKEDKQPLVKSLSSNGESFYINENGYVSIHL